MEEEQAGKKGQTQPTLTLAISEVADFLFMQKGFGNELNQFEGPYRLGLTPTWRTVVL